MPFSTSQMRGRGGEPEDGPKGDSLLDLRRALARVRGPGAISFRVCALTITLMARVGSPKIQRDLSSSRQAVPFKQKGLSCRNPPKPCSAAAAGARLPGCCSSCSPGSHAHTCGAPAIGW